MFTVAMECGRTSIVTPQRGPGVAPVGDAAAVPRREELQAMAEGLATTALRWPGLPGFASRRWEVLALSDTFEAWVIGWPPGGTIALHDHGDSAGAVVVAGGELVETLVVARPDGTVGTTVRRMTAGTSWTMPRGHVHDIVNHAALPAVSVHVYAPRLTSMTHYRLDQGLLLAERTVHYPVAETTTGADGSTPSDGARVPQDGQLGPRRVSMRPIS